MEPITQTNEGFPQAKQPWLRNAGIISLFIYAFFWLLNIEISRIGESLMLLFFLVMLFTNKPKFLLKEPILYLLIAWVIFQFSVYQWSSSMFPELANEHITEARHITKIFLFVVVAWWLGGNSRLVIAMVLLCTIGFILGATFQDNGLVDSVEQFQKHLRLDYGYRNAQHTAVYGSFSLLALIAFQRKIILSTSERYQWLIKTLLYLLIAYSIIVVLSTQARATWLGLIITGIIFFIVWCISKLKSYRSNLAYIKPTNLQISTIIASITVIMISVLVLTTYDIAAVVTKRIKIEAETLERLAEGDLKHINMNSIGIRIDSWRMALDWVKERPISGWGAQTRKALIQKSNWPQKFKNRFGHLHNSYIELLVSYGIIGLLLFGSLFLYIWFRAYQSWKKNIIPSEVMFFIGLWTIYWLIVNCFESYIIYSDTGNKITIITAGILYTYHLKRIAIYQRI